MSKPNKTKDRLKDQSEVVDSPIAVSRPKAMVFLSHDSRDGDLAEAFGNLLTDASGGILKSFRSSDKSGSAGIEYGAEWYPAVMKALDDATDVVALLTQHSIDRPWILYEAGVAKGKLNTVVFGVALGVPLEHVSTGPFAQFQNSADDENSLTKLVLQLIRRNPDAAPREEAVRRQVQVFRDSEAKLIKARKVPVHSAAGKADETTVAKMFEEVKVMFATLPERLEDKMRDAMRRRGGLRRPFHPMMLEELLFHAASVEGPGGGATAWLMFISAVRDDLPWIYDIGMEMYRALCSQDQTAIDVARRNLRSAMEVTRSSRALRHLAPDDEISHMQFRHLPEMVDHFLERIALGRGRPERAKVPPPRPSAKEPGEGEAKP